MLQEGRDKAYLLKMLQDASKKHNRPKASSTTRLLSGGSEASSTLTSLSPGILASTSSIVTLNLVN